MRSVGFDYPNTCPKIDKAINSAKSEIYKFLDDLLDEACPLLSRVTRGELADGYTSALYGALEDIFEDTRSTNEDMRKEADSQIEALKDEISNLEHELRIVQEQS